MDEDQTAETDPTSDEEPATTAHEPLVVHSSDLLQGRREIWIRHGDQVYRLRQTGSGKLYLSK